jgi:hypothetical protein
MPDLLPPLLLSLLRPVRGARRGVRPPPLSPPMGLPGWMVFDPVAGVQSGYILASDASERRLYIYRTVSLRGQGATEVLACATRRGGIGATRFEGGGRAHTLHTASFPGLDVVDVCGVGTTPESQAVAAVGLDGTLVLFRDVLTDRKPQTVRFRMIEGVAYRLLSCRGHLFLLTSKAVYVLLDLAGGFLAGQSVQAAATVAFSLPVKAVDMNLCGDRYLLVVTADNEVLRFDIPVIESSAPADLEDGERRPFDPTALDPVWERRGVEQEARLLHT